ncbi:YjfK family protein [Caulobacter sp. 1776]|uniref:YjfK family protein n=1 Tax=Caulobacter sp. 1776 TaxID=3156420 RepID=UPI00339B6E4D
MFGKLFGNRDDASRVALPIIRNVTIGRTMVLDPLAWRRFGTETKFALDRDTLEITAQGLIQLNDGAFVHRFYTDDEILFQVVSDDREGQKANDFTVFVPWASAYPGDRADRDLWSQRLRASTFQPEGLPPYRRLWFGEETAEQDPVTLWEDVYYDREARAPDRRLFQTTMLFHRDLAGGDGRELLLALTLEPEDSKDVSHETMIGLPLSVGEFRA